MTMPLDRVIEQINDVTKTEVNMILDEGRIEAESITKKAQKEAAAIREQGKINLQRTLADLKEVRLSKTRMKYKRKKLDMEREVIHRLWKSVENKVACIDETTNKKLIKKLLHIARATPVFSICSIAYINDDLCEVPTQRPFYIYSSARDEEMIRKYSDLEYSGHIECLGGIVAESEDRNWKINLKYDSILEEVFENSMKKVYKNLLGE